MARSIRIEFAGAFYHVMARGNRRERIFKDEEDRQLFVKSLGDACARTGWRVHAWLLLGNHYHLMLETPEPNLVARMKWLQNTLTRRYNYETLMDYIHLNPVRAGLVRSGRGESVLDYPWSSVAAGYALPAAKRAEWLAVAEGLAMFGFSDTVSGRRRMVERLDRRAIEEGWQRCGTVALPEEVDARCSHLRRGWYWGSQSFAERMLKMAEKTLPRRKSRADRGAALRQAHVRR